jgi:hypothetical protein
MAYTLEYNRKLQIVELVCTGRYTSQESLESTTKAIALGKENGDANALVDASEAEFNMSVVDFLILPEREYVEQDMNRRIRVALVPPTGTKDKEDARFYETVCVNRGWKVRIFSSRDAAIEWLTEKDSPIK